MAGGPLARSVPCYQCLEKGRVTRAFRLIEGVESDQYLCWRGHLFGVDYRRGPPSEKQWPPPKELKDALKK
jgi:hypothetical protein